MKKILIMLLLLFLSASTFARGSKKAPQGTYMWEDFEKAKAEAVTKKKPLLMMYTDLNTK